MSLEPEPDDSATRGRTPASDSKGSAWHRLKSLAGHRYHTSVLRRSMLLLTLLVPAYCANLAIMYVGAKLLSADQFGLFYVANTLGNILFSGSVILNMFFTRHLVTVVPGGGEATAFGQMRRIERAVVSWGGGLAAGVFIAMLAVSGHIGVQSHLIILLIVLDAFTSYLGELGRVMLQYLHRTVWLGLYTLLWMVLRLTLCVAGMLISRTVWGGLAGVVLSTVLVYAGFHLWVARCASPPSQQRASLPSVVSVIPTILGYGLSILISNLDILLSYLSLNPTDLSAYSASSLFPKAMLVVTTPLLQMLFPAMVANKAPAGAPAILFGKIGVTMLGLSVAGIAFIWQLSGQACGGPWGMPLCEPSLLEVMLLSVVPLVLLRLIVLTEFASGRDWTVLWLAAPVALFLAAIRLSPPDKAAMAGDFAIFSVAVVVFALLISVFASRQQRKLASAVDVSSDS
jgi:hypothetical protein